MQSDSRQRPSDWDTPVGAVALLLAGSAALGVFHVLVLLIRLSEVLQHTE